MEIGKRNYAKQCFTRTFSLKGRWISYILLHLKGRFESLECRYDKFHIFHEKKSALQVSKEMAQQ